MTQPINSRRATVLIGACAALLALAGCKDDGASFDLSSQIGADPVLPDPDPALLPGMKVANVVGWSAGQTPAVADGLAITAYASDLVSPRTVHTLPNGDVLVVQSRGPGLEPTTRPKDAIRGWIMSMAHGGGGGPQKPSNIVTLLRDTNRDGTVDERHDLLTDLNSPFGLAWADDTLYVAATDAILAYPYKLGDSAVGGAPTVLAPLPGGPIDHHWTKDLALSPDGASLFVGVGSNSNIVENGIEAEKGRAAIWKVDRKTGAARVYASGLRNPNGLTFQPGTGTLWAVINERDELGPNLVPDYLTSVKDGAFYGWPWSYYGDHVDPRVHPQRPDMVAQAIAPDFALSSHVAPLGLTFADGSAMPAAFTDGAFVGEHGSWNRTDFNGYRVVFVPFENGAPVGKTVDVVTGFIEGDNAHGRPVGVGIDGTGALLVADDAGNTVWRVAAADGTTIPSPVGTDGQTLQAASQAGAANGSTGSSATAAAEPQADTPADRSAEPSPAQTQIAPAALPAEGAAPAGGGN